MLGNQMRRAYRHVKAACCRDAKPLEMMTGLRPAAILGNGLDVTFGMPSESNLPKFHG